MRGTHIYILLLIIFTLAGCGNKDYDRMLSNADSLLFSSATTNDNIAQAQLLLDSLAEKESSLTRRQRAHFILLTATSLKAKGDTLPNDSLMQIMTDYYTSHGAKNTRMKAYYLRGYSLFQREKNLQALDYYNQAISYADTTDVECDFRQLAIIHVQKADILRRHLLMYKSIEENRIAYRCAMKAKDTVLAVMCYGFPTESYDLLQKKDTMLLVAKDAYNLAKKYNLPQQAATNAGSIAYALIDLKRFDEVKPYIEEYEAHSGMFDEEGNIDKGFETHYYVKALYYIGINKLDSALFMLNKKFPKTSINNIECYYRGMLALYKKKNQIDSIAKYADLTHKATDEHYLESHAAQFINSENAFNYNYYKQKIVEKQRQVTKIRYILYIIMSSATLITMLFVLWYRNRKQRIRENIKQLRELYRIKEEEISQEKEDIVKLQQHEFKTLIKEKENHLIRLNEEKNQLYEVINKKDKLLSTYRQKRKEATLKPNVEEMLSDNFDYQQLLEYVARPLGIFSEEIIGRIICEFDNAHPYFRQFVTSHYPKVTSTEYTICVLIRLGLKPGNVGTVLNIQSSNLSKIRSRLLSKIFKKEGGSSVFDKEIRKI